MRGVYVHIPFCIAKCGYCDFNSYAGQFEKTGKYISAVLKEGEKYKGERADTFYIGGGTPTALEKEELLRLIEGLKDIFSFENECEFTVEMNPGTADFSYLKALKEEGVNRISMGAQTFEDTLLKKIGRIHSANDIFSGVEMCRRAGFDNISIDLMFSLPGQSMEHWKDSLKKAASLNISHISCYGLKIEEGTPFYEKGITPLPEETDREMYHYAIDFLESKGFSQYEISNFARDNKKSRHNLKYWQCKEYFGLGAGAHRYLSLSGENQRAWNVKAIDEYIEKIEHNADATAEKTVLTPDDMATEKIIMGLRLCEGIDEKLLNKDVEKYIKAGFIIRNNGKVFFSRKGFDVSNAILCELI